MPRCARSSWGPVFVPHKGPEFAWCGRLEAAALRRLRRVCDRFSGTDICVRNPNLFATYGCRVPLATVAECCAAGYPVIGFDGKSQCP
jgi:hypothetical protein